VATTAPATGTTAKETSRRPFDNLRARQFYGHLLPKDRAQDGEGRGGQVITGDAGSHLGARRRREPQAGSPARTRSPSAYEVALLGHDRAIRHIKSCPRRASRTRDRPREDHRDLLSIWDRRVMRVLSPQ